MARLDSLPTKTVPEPAPATYTSLDDVKYGYDTTYTSLDEKEDEKSNNYISRALLFGTSPVNQKDLTIRDTFNIGLRPD